LSQPGALTTALNYYRANLSGEPMAYAQAAIIRAETLVLWGERDPALLVDLLDGIERVATRVEFNGFRMRAIGCSAKLRIASTARSWSSWRVKGRRPAARAHVPGDTTGRTRRYT
jgi:hypothetical protein